MAEGLVAELRGMLAVQFMIRILRTCLLLDCLRRKEHAIEPITRARLAPLLFFLSLAPPPQFTMVVGGCEALGLTLDEHAALCEVGAGSGLGLLAHAHGTHPQRNAQLGVRWSGGGEVEFLKRSGVRGGRPRLQRERGEVLRSHLVDFLV